MTHDMVWVSRKEIADLLRPIVALCAEIEAASTLPENSGDDRSVWGFNNQSITLGQLRAVKRLYDEVAK
jgi:hypothetical protein